MTQAKKENNMKQGKIGDELLISSEQGEDVELSQSEKIKFGVKPKKEKNKEPEHKEIKKRIKKEKIKDRLYNLKIRFKNFITSQSLYKGISISMDYVFNAFVLILLAFTVFLTVKFLIQEKPIMALVSGVITWILMKINERIQ